MEGASPPTMTICRQDDLRVRLCGREVTHRVLLDRVVVAVFHSAGTVV